MAINTKWLLPFAATDTDISTLSTTQIKIKPRENISDDSKMFNFDLGNMGEYYANLASLKLYIKGAVKTTEKGNLTDKDDVAIGNNFIHNLFSRISVTIGQNQSRLIYDDYNYTSMLHIVDEKERLDQSLNSMVFIPNNGITIKVPGTEDTEYMSYAARKALCKNSKPVYLFGPLFADLLDMNSFLPKNVPVSIQMEKNKITRYMEATITEGREFDFFISDISIYVDLVLPPQALSQSIEDTLATKNGIYRFNHLDVKKFVIPQNITSINIPRIWQGTLPRRFAFAFLPQLSYDGNYAKDSTKLVIDIIKNVTLKVNERQLLEIDVKSDNNMLCYNNLLQFLQTGEKTLIDLNIFQCSLGYIAIDLNTLCQKNDSCITEIHPQGTMNVEIEFSKTITEPYVMFLFSFTDANVAIDRYKNALITTSIG